MLKATLAETGNALVAVVAAKTPIQLVLALRGFDCTTQVIESVRAALAEFPAQPPDVVVIEHETGLDAFALTRSLRTFPELARTPILIVAAGEGRTERRAALQAGATDLMLKPVDTLDLQIRLRTLIELAAARRDGDRKNAAMNQQIERAVAEVSAREREIVRRLMLAAEFRDDQAGDHLTRVAGCAIAVAEGLGLSETDANDIALASTMHDIGKIGIADEILLKPGPLTDAEREEMKQHALRGYRMLHDSPSHLLQLASEIALTHHERWDGNGYPQGLKGEEIPLSGRIVAVADVFDALISARVYKPAWPVEQARAHLEAQAGTHFDPACVAAFVSRWEDIVALVQDRPATSHAA
ncbi:HD-GYP domain-containing protein [Methylobacterium haplocladii]|nr:HD domain-containing phosphohydrolase [Methylobacterium haplocladii]GJD84006.1 hypothetical protein HPGCJGGD_1881 [Methylobacterium haplocladii]GLS59236.1 two-component system response regulator [Methylobacterium haplocladii]